MIEIAFKIAASKDVTVTKFMIDLVHKHHLLCYQTIKCKVVADLVAVFDTNAQKTG